MKKIISLLGLMAFFAFGVYADNEVNSVFNSGATGTTSATAIVPPGKGTAVITDMITRYDAGNVTATTHIRTAKAVKPVTSATSASGSVVYFDNSASLVAASGYLLVKDGSGSYQLLRASAVATTSVTVYQTITAAMTVNDFVYPLNTSVQRPALNAISATAQAEKYLYLPESLPAAITLDGNTTSCAISISGVRSAYK